MLLSFEFPLQPLDDCLLSFQTRGESILCSDLSVEFGLESGVGGGGVRDLGLEGGDSSGGLVEGRRLRRGSEEFEEGGSGIETETGGDGCETPGGSREGEGRKRS